MDSITIRHLRESVALLPMENFGPADEFYRRLFELAPEVRPMFNREIGPTGQKVLGYACVGDHQPGPSR